MPIKPISLLFVTLFLLSLNLLGSSFTKTATVAPTLLQEGSQKEWCPVCGMKIEDFYKTSHTSVTHNHKNRQYCSMRCLVVDMKEQDIKIDDIKVVDASTQKLIDAKKAFYVVGSDVAGTMSKVSKLAFASREVAEDFNMEHGGKIVDFNTAINIAKESLTSDVEMLESKKSIQIYPMGEKIFNKNCKKEIEIDKYFQINELKSAIKDKKLCGELKESELQPLSLYLWEVKRFANLKSVDGVIKVTKDEKCPICGMFVYKYPKWVAQIFYKDKRISFDGVKDMMKYYFSHKNGVIKILVTDYYSQKTLDVRKAYFVVGSDIYGPMGDELIPFDSRNSAKSFSVDHKGFKILGFSEIKNAEVLKLDK
ncbi:nitrous oxide reductase accessory protein NosL [Sulfurimonas sp.]|uniref:nitrous oxide reductase accessory protein NosL n=1 Tax=Sulfurimonas sp. TaxID=2022749 RepID=UPI0025D15B3F|nr:nitrous oxide reductase accessory protein NosL [Sulfurimonas sp.]